MTKIENMQELEILYPEISSEIIKMRDVDQEMRHRVMANNGLPTSDADFEVDKNNTSRMRQIVAQIGWPNVSKVGRDASTAAWLLVQHADHDVDFQNICLELMNTEEEGGEVSKKDIAMLTDRVKVNQNIPQIYGTQFRQIDGKHVPKEIENMEGLNERRLSMGLDTFEENLEIMNKKYPTK